MKTTLFILVSKLNLVITSNSRNHVILSRAKNLSRSPLRLIILTFLLVAFIVACSPSAQEPEVGQSSEPEAQVEEQELETEHDEDHNEEHSEHNDTEHSEHNDAEHEDDGEHRDHRDHGAHEHGVAVLTVAWSGNEMAMDLETPAFNILGFEYAPSTTAEKELLDESLALLQEGTLFQILSPDAKCTVTDAVVNTALDEDSHEHDEEHGEHDNEHEDEEGETHSDIDISYNLICENSNDIEALDASELFAQFPNFEELQVQWLSDTQQSAKTLNPSDPVVLLE